VHEIDGRPAWEVWKDETRAAAKGRGLDPDTLEPGRRFAEYLNLFEAGLDTGAAEGSNTPEDCTTPTFGSLGHLTSGDLVVTDAPPPPGSTRQCLSGGYRAYGFATTGLCVAYVNAGRLAAGDSRG